MKKLVIAALAIVATPAMAQTLWRDLEVGMTRQQVETLYPRERRSFDLTEGCPARLSFEWDDQRRLRAIKIASRAGLLGARTECFNAISAGLRQSYGRPRSTRHIDTTLIRGFPHWRQVEQWVSGTVVITYTTTDEDQWEVYYEKGIVTRVPRL